MNIYTLLLKLKLIFIFMLNFNFNYMFFWFKEKEIGDEKEVRKREIASERGRQKEEGRV